ncbi:MAG: hypothetical protein MJ064_06415 [Lachnospiraceae bacterium]|nr:hypothetical protein [Lachnospiraceae bacterium]
MSANGWLIIALTGFALAAVSLAFSVILFFRYKIPALISDLSGRQAAKEVAALRGDSEEAMKNARSSGHTSDFKAMALAHESKRLDVRPGKAQDLSAPAVTVATEELPGSSVTEELSGVQEIGITQVLNQGITMVLAEPEVTGDTADLKRVSHFVITRSITEIHTEEYV